MRGKSVSEAKKAKTVVMGMVERGGAIKTRVVDDAKKRRLIPVLLENVQAGSMVNTDTLSSYRDLSKLGYRLKCSTTKPRNGRAAYTARTA